MINGKIYLIMKGHHHQQYPVWEGEKKC